MDEKNKDKQVPEIKINNEALKSLTNNLLKNDDSINALMKIATNLLGDGSLLNSVKDVNKLKQSTSLNSVSTVENKDLTPANETSSAQIEMKKELLNMQAELANQLSTISATMTNYFTDLKAEVAELKAQNEKLLEQISKIQHNYKIKKKKK
jgi:hypothetical protein